MKNTDITIEEQIKEVLGNFYSNDDYYRHMAVKDIMELFSQALAEAEKKGADNERENLKIELLSKSITKNGLTDTDISEIFKKYENKN